MARIRRTSLLAVSLTALLLAPAGAGARSAPSAGERVAERASAAKAAAPVVASAGRSAAVREYLARVHAKMRFGWNEVQDGARMMYPPGHPANHPNTMAEVTIRLNADGQPTSVRMTRRSGVRVFDNSALKVAGWLRDLPPLPAELRDGHVSITWQFYRDSRGCKPAYARITIGALSPEEALQRALERRDWARARAVLTEHGARPTVAAIIAEAGIRSGQAGLRRLALRLAPSRRVVAFLSGRGADDLWDAGVAELAERRAHGSLVYLARRYVAPRGSMRARAVTSRSRDRARCLQIVRVMKRCKTRVPRALTRQLLSDHRPAVVFAALGLVRSQAVLQEVADRAKLGPDLAVAMAVRRRSLGPDARATKTIRAALRGPRQLAAVEALAAYPLRCLAPDLARLARSSRTPVAVRERALQVLAQLQTEMGAFYVAMRGKIPRLQIAAARALATFTCNHRGISYRLADLAYTSRGQVKAEALAAQARIGLEKFLADVLWRTSRLSTPHKALVARNLWGFGAAAVPALTKMARHGESQLREAAIASLRRLDCDEARSALAGLDDADQHGGRAPTARAARSRSPIRQLLLLAARASSR